MIVRTHLTVFHQKQWKEVFEEEGKVANNKQYLLLAHMVRVVFAVPVASSKTERVFSVSGSKY